MAEHIKKYFPELDDTQVAKLLHLGMLLASYNEEVNVISKKDIVNVLPHHILPALALGKIAHFGKGRRILDIGTGGGLPGLPLAIMFPHSEFFLSDSIGKKINIVKRIIEDLELRNAHAAKVRSNEIKEKFDYIVGRGVSGPKSFRQLAKKNLSNPEKGERIFYLSGEDKATDFETKNLHDFIEEDYALGKSIYIL